MVGKAKTLIAKLTGGDQKKEEPLKNKAEHDAQVKAGLAALDQEQKQRDVDPIKSMEVKYMFIAWQGVGMYTALVYLVLLMLINASIFLHYNVSLLNKINWWLPALITAVFNAWFVPFVKRKRREATPQNYWGRFFSFVGNRDSFFGFHYVTGRRYCLHSGCMG